MTPSLVLISRSTLKMTLGALLDLTTRVPLKHSIADLSKKMKLLLLLLLLSLLLSLSLLLLLLLLLINNRKPT